MKNIIRLFFLFTVLGLASCGSKSISTDSIVGTWQVTAADLKLNNMPEGAEAMEGAMKKALLETKYIFNKDATYKVEAIFPSSGTWKYDEAQKAIILNREGADKEPRLYRILSSSSDKMEVKNDKGEQGYIDLTLERTKESAE